METQKRCPQRLPGSGQLRDGPGHTGVRSGYELELSHRHLELETGITREPFKEGLRALAQLECGRLHEHHLFLEADRERLDGIEEVESRVRFRRAVSGHQDRVLQVVLPGVFRPISDTWLLAACLRDELKPGAEVADVCTGSGVLAVTAKLHGAGSVTAVDASRRAVLSARLSAWRNGVAIRTVRGDLFAPLAGRRFDLIVSNPPYVPAETDAIPQRGASRAWDAGRSGRVLLDRLCEQAPGHLRDGGALLVVHSSMCGENRTRHVLEHAGLTVDVMARKRGPLGPLMAQRVALLERRGMLNKGQRNEEMLVFRARKRIDIEGQSGGEPSGAHARPAATGGADTLVDTGFAGQSNRFPNAVAPRSAVPG